MLSLLKINVYVVVVLFFIHGLVLQITKRWNTKNLSNGFMDYGLVLVSHHGTNDLHNIEHRNKNT